MSSDPPINQPENTLKSIQGNFIQEYQLNQRRSISLISQPNLYNIQSVQQNDAGGTDGFIEPATNGSLLTPAAQQSTHVLKKTSIVATTLPGIEINYGNSTSLDEPNKQDDTVKEVLVPIHQNDQANNDVLVTPEKSKEPTKAHGVSFPNPDKCNECGQSILPAPERCTGCGQIIPATCSSCGQLVPSPWLWRERSDYNRHFGYGYYDKWSYENAFCRATTSRKLSQSSGDYDDSPGSHCSCNSTTEYVATVAERPCVIADSNTALHKSRWTKFKRYCQRVGKKARAKVGYINQYCREQRRPGKTGAAQ